MKKILLFLFIFPLSAFAAGNINTTAELLKLSNQNIDTACATAEFNNALAENAYMVSEDDDRDVIRDWIYDILQSPETLAAVLACPEIDDKDENATLFMPIHYEFPNGRTLDINYETQPKILRQRLALDNKRSLPSSDPNPKIGDPLDTSIWTNTDPAWYAIMVVQHGTLDSFIGSDKNNTISNILKFKDVELNKVNFTVNCNNKEVAFTKKEFELLKLLMENENQTLTKSMIFDSIWNDENSADDNTLNVHISKIKNKLKECNPDEEYIETVWSIGYRLKK